MISIVVHGILGTAYRQEVVVEGGSLADGDMKVLHDIRHYLSNQYGDGTPTTGWAMSAAPSGMWLHRVERAFDTNYAPAYLMFSFLIPRGKRLDDEAVLGRISRAMILNHSKFIRQNVIQYECDWSFLGPLSQDVEENLVPDGGAVSGYTAPPDGEAAFYQGDLSQMLRNMWSVSFARYGTVFCGKGLLTANREHPSVEVAEPASYSQMVSDNGEEGYKVLTTNDVDIDDIEYYITYDNPNNYFTSKLKKSVRKKDLETSVGDFRCGRLERSGYRPAEVYIPSGTQSSDGETINVELPILVPKSASVSLRIIDKATGNLFLSGETTVEWKKGKFYDSSWEKRTAKNGLYKFEREECDEVWTVKVSSKGYDDMELPVTIADGFNGKVDVQLTFNPTWTINVISPINPGKFPVKQSEKYAKIEKLKSNLESAGLVVVQQPEDAANRTVTIKAEYPLIKVKIILDSQKISEMSVPNNELYDKIEELKRCYADQGLEFDKRDDSNGNVKLYFKKKEVVLPPSAQAGGNSPHDDSNSVNSVVSDQPPTSDPGPRSENTYKKKNEESFAKPIEKKKWLLQLDKKSKKFSVFKDAPDKIIKDDNISYDKDNHRLVIECQDRPTVEPKFAKVEKDHYSYKLKLEDEDKVVWRQETEDLQAYKVVRKLKTKYMLMFVVLSLLVVGALALAIMPKPGGDKYPFAEQKGEMEHFNEQVKGFECYCGDFTLMADAEQCHSECLKIIEGLEKNKKQEKAQQDSLYRAFKSLYQKQCDFRLCDSVNFAQLKFLEKSINDWNDEDKESYGVIKDKIGDLTAPMSEAHRKQVNDWVKEREREKEIQYAQQDAKEKSDLKKVNGPRSADAFIKDYGQAKYGGRYSEDVGAVNAFKTLCENTNRTLEECNGFLNNYQSEYPDSKMVKKVNEWVKNLGKKLQDTQIEV